MEGDGLVLVHVEGVEQFLDVPGCGGAYLRLGVMISPVRAFHTTDISWKSSRKSASSRSPFFSVRMSQPKRDFSRSLPRRITLR